MSDQYYWKKQGERDDLARFLAAYAQATGESLAVVEDRETPDFVCEREDGQRVGVELTKIVAHPETRQWHRLFGSGSLICSSDIACYISDAAQSKAEKLRSSEWPASETILANQLFDNLLNEIHQGLDQMDSDDFTESGFAEIWVADHSTIDAFGCVELFGVYPRELAGYYALTRGLKPYG